MSESIKVDLIVIKSTQIMNENIDKAKERYLNWALESPN